MGDRKINRMHRLYGGSEYCCADCSNFVTRLNGYYKCAVYGIGNGRATDWCGSYPACGHYNQPRRKGETPVHFLCKHR